MAALLALFVADHDAWTPDEPRVIGLVQSVSQGSVVVPRLNDDPFLEQPPLYEWAVAGGFRLFGESVVVARAVSALFGAIALVATYLYGRHLAGRRVGALAALSLGFSFEFFNTTHRVVPDSALVACVAASAYASLRGLTADGRSRTEWLLLAYALASLAYLAKGVVGVGLSGFAFLAVVAARREPRALLSARLWAAPLVFAAMTGPWHFALTQELGLDALHEVTFGQALQRAVGGRAVAPHEQPFWYYFALLVPALLPAGAFFVAGVGRFGRERALFKNEERFAHETPLLWLALTTLGLTLAVGKRSVYLVPAFPAAAVISGLWLDSALTAATRPRLLRAFALGLAAGLAATGPALVVAAWKLNSGLGLAWAGGAVILGVGGLALRQAWHGREEHGLAVVAVGFAVALWVATQTVVPVVDRMKGLGEFFAAAGKHVPEDRAVHVIWPDEATRGAFPFATDRPIVPLDGRPDLKRRLDGAGELWLLVVEKNEIAAVTSSLLDLEPDIVLAQDRTGARALRLLRFQRARRP